MPLPPFHRLGALFVAVLLLVGLAMPAAAGKPYVIVLNGGREVEARQAPVFRNGMAYFYTASGNTYTALPEKQIDRDSTVAANADAAPPPSAAPQQSLAGVKLKKEKTGELRKLERTSKPAVAPAPSAAGAGAAGTATAPTATAPGMTDAELEKLLLAELARQLELAKARAAQAQSAAEDAAAGGAAVEPAAPDATASEKD